MAQWIVFSVGITRHFYIYQPLHTNDTHQVEIESITAIERLMDEMRCPDVMFVTRYDTCADYIYKKALDRIIKRLRKKYPRRLISSESELLDPHY
jgi:hypothetical protein